jgi:hypothetical protein
VTFPSTVVINNSTTNPDSSFICMSCHQGRESKSTVDAAITAGTYAFKNIHYLAAGATIYGSQAHVGYEYTGKTYASKFNHWGGTSSQCVYCHVVTAAGHEFMPEVTATCQECHTGAVTVDDLRMNRDADYNGNGNNTEPLADEVNSLLAKLLTQIQAYATTAGHPIAYTAAANPYWFNDLNGNGVADTSEAVSANKFTNWDATLMKATFNYQYGIKEPGAWAHNTKYIVQLIIDSIQDLGGDVSALTRP